MFSASDTVVTFLSIQIVVVAALEVMASPVVAEAVVAPSKLRWLEFYQ